jgi:hypothetical protein
MSYMSYMSYKPSLTSFFLSLKSAMWMNRQPFSHRAEFAVDKPSTLLRRDPIMNTPGWIGVDLDGTLAYYSGWKGPKHIGDPVPVMAMRVRNWLAQGREVRIFTARACVPTYVRHVENWSKTHFGVKLTVTNTKDFAMLELWDDRCVRVHMNTGQIDK